METVNRITSRSAEFQTKLAPHHNLSAIDSLFVILLYCLCDVWRWLGSDGPSIVVRIEELLEHNSRYLPIPGCHCSVCIQRRRFAERVFCFQLLSANLSSNGNDEELKFSGKIDTRATMGDEFKRVKAIFLILPCNLCMCSVLRVQCANDGRKRAIIH